MDSISKHSLICEMFIDAAHRLSNYEGKCKRIHGHTYRIIVEVKSTTLLNWGAVMDFSDLKKIMTEHINDKYDHKLLLYDNDPLNKQIATALPKDDWVTWMNVNTSAENISKEIYRELQVVIKVLTKNTVSMKKVTVYETPKNAASYEEI